MKENKINKTNAARLLDKAKIAYELIPYEVDEKDLSAIHVAASLGEDIEQVFKTLILHGDKTGYFVCVIPGEHEVDLKLAAKVSGNKKCDLIPMKELLPLTGYIRGGLGDVKVKRFLNSIMQEELEPIRNRRKEFEKDIPAIYEMLRKGCEVARAAAADTLSDVRKAMKINYFDDAELINEQVKRFNK